MVGAGQAELTHQVIRDVGQLPVGQHRVVGAVRDHRVKHVLVRCPLPQPADRPVQGRDQVPDVRSGPPVTTRGRVQLVGRLVPGDHPRVHVLVAPTRPHQVVHEPIRPRAAQLRPRLHNHADTTRSHTGNLTGPGPAGPTGPRPTPRSPAARAGGPRPPRPAVGRRPDRCCSRPAPPGSTGSRSGPAGSPGHPGRPRSADPGPPHPPTPHPARLPRPARHR